MTKMYQSKLNRILNLLKNIKNDILVATISSFLDWFYDKLNIQLNKRVPDYKLKKGDIFFINLGQNIGSELNKTRPGIIHSIKRANFGDTIVVIPLKSFKLQNKINDFQIFIKMTKNNNLLKDSVVDIPAIRQISKKRLLNKIGNIEKEYLDEIDLKLLNILGIKK